MPNQKNSKLAQWLDQLQEQSWNLELIVSGFVLFGLFQLRDFLVVKVYYLSANGDDTLQLFAKSLDILKISIDIFIFSLLALVFMRGLWIGAIGLRYVSGNIDFDSFRYSDKFKQYLKRKVGDFDNYIHRLEQISSSIFAFTYLLFFLSLSLLLIDFEFKLLFNLVSKAGIEKLTNITMLSYMAVHIIVFFDFLTLGLLKSIKQPIFSSIYLVLYKLIGVLTLSFLWRPIWYNFIDQKTTKWLAAFAVPFLLGFLVINTVSFQNYSYEFFPKLQYKTESGRFSSVYYKENTRASFQSEFYDNLRQVERAEGNYETIEVLSLPTHRIDVPLLEVFVKYSRFIDNFIERQDSSLAAINKIGINSLGEFNVLDFLVIKKTRSEYEQQYDERQAAQRAQYDSLSRIDPARANSLFIAFEKNEELRYRNYLEQVKSMIKQSFSFEINTHAVPDSSIFLDFHIHSNLGEKGFICTFPLEHAHLGTNHLTLNRKFYNDSAKEYYEREFTIPFIYMGAIVNGN